MDLFLHPPNAELFLEVLFEQQECGRCFVHEFVLMPNHIHLLLTPTEKNSLERLMQYIKGGFAFRHNRERGKVTVWQAGFTRHRIEGARDYEKHREYTFMNPVKAGLVSDPRLYEWSSANPRWNERLAPCPQGLKPVLTWGAVSPA